MKRNNLQEKVTVVQRRELSFEATFQIKSGGVAFIGMSDKQVSLVLIEGSDQEACEFGSNLETKSTYMSQK